MAIIGEGFFQWMKKQVEVRQRVLGQGFSTTNPTRNFDNSKVDSNTSFLNASPWIRMVSSVDLKDFTEEERKKASVPDDTKTIGQLLSEDSRFNDLVRIFKGDKLAKKFILHNGVETKGKGLRGMYSGKDNKVDGRAKAITYPFGGAYGFGNQEGDNNSIENGQGFAPMPGIESVDFKYKNDGALSTAEIKIKVFTQWQFQLIDILYQRPGYTVLLEFGHTSFLDNEGNTQFAGEGEYATTEPFSFIWKRQTEQFKLAAAIAKEKQKWCGNYEGNFMKIMKYNWKFNNDGSYDVTVNLVGTGDVINSLKVNVANNKKLKLDNEAAGGPDEDDRKDAGEIGLTVVSDAVSSKFNYKLYLLYQAMQDKDSDSTDLSWWEVLIPLYNVYAIARTIITKVWFTHFTISESVVSPFPVPLYKIQNDDGSLRDAARFKLFDTSTWEPSFKDQFSPKRVFIGFAEGSDIDDTSITISGGQFSISNTNNSVQDPDEYDPQTYITFGHMLALLLTNCNLVDAGGKPLLWFDFNFSNLNADSNYMKTFPGHFSSDPNICVIKPTQLSPLVSMSGFMKTIRWQTMDFIKAMTEGDIAKFHVEGKPTLGRIANVYLDINFIAKTLQQNRDDETQTVSVIDFLNGVLSGMNEALGGINDFRVLFNENTQMIDIISQVPMDNEGELLQPELTTINTFGLKPGQGSFVTDVDLKAELTDKFATQISVGAQSNGNVQGGNGGSFSLFNFGLIDRIIPVKKIVDDAEKTETIYTDEVEESDDPVGDLWGDEVDECFYQMYEDFEFGMDYVNPLKNVNNDYCNMVLNHMSSGKCLGGKPTAPAPFFLPFNLGLTMHGISGLRIFQAFRHDGKIMPYSFDNNKIQLIIKAYSHKVGVDGWTTSIETMSKPLVGEIEAQTPAPQQSLPGPAAGGVGGRARTSSNSRSVGRSSTSSASSTPGEVPSGTLTSGFPLNKIYYDGPTNKTQIYIHHTAGATKSPARTVAGWNKRTDHVATHYITNNLGDVEQLYADEAWANHLGIKGATFKKYKVKYQNLNPVSLGIEMQSYGWCKLQGGKYVTAYGNSIPANSVGRPVDKNGRPTTYKGYKYYQKYNDQHIANVKTILLRWMNKYNIPFKYDYDTLFVLNKKALSGTPGIYTHNSVKLGKTDVWPQKELLDMLKSISS